MGLSPYQICSFIDGLEGENRVSVYLIGFATSVLILKAANKIMKNQRAILILVALISRLHLPHVNNLNITLFSFPPTRIRDREFSISSSLCLSKPLRIPQGGNLDCDCRIPLVNSSVCLSYICFASLLVNVTISLQLCFIL